MSTLTPNYNLEKPEATDPFGDFRQSYNDNMDIIDSNLGGGGGGGGHTIVDENGSDMPAESKLQFTGNVSVTDDNVNGATVVDVLGGGGNVYGAFLDPSRVVYSAFTFDSSAHTWTATEDVILTDNLYPVDGSTASYILIDGKGVFASYTFGDPFVYVKKGQVVTYRGKSGSNMKAYGILQGTNGIYAPVIYSDNERVIGVWRDNKPLYQRTFDLGSDLSISYSAWVSSGVTLTNVENLITAYGTRSDNSFQGYVLAWNDNTDLKLTTPRNGNNSFIRYLTLQYTKTTDVAGSGNWNTDGVPTHHYSTSEQVIGTWIDGKPLYEKTFTHSGALIVNDSFDNTIGTLSAVDQFTSCEGYFRRTNANGLMYSLNGGTRPESGADSYKVTTRFYNGNVQVAVKGYSDIEYIALTVRYTKTTD